MKIMPTQQNFGAKAPCRKFDRVSIAAGTVLASAFLGTGYLFVDKDYYDSKHQITQNNIINMENMQLQNLVSTFGINKLKFEGDLDNGYSYSAKTGNFEKISGTLYKSKNDENFMIGTFKKEGLFKDDNYTFSLKYNPSKLKYFPHYDIQIALHPMDKPDEEKIVKIEQKFGSDRIYLDGEELTPRDVREEKNIISMLTVISLAALGLIATDKNKEK